MDVVKQMNRERESEREKEREGKMQEALVGPRELSGESKKDIRGWPRG